MSNKSFFECDCGCSVLLVNEYEDEDILFFSTYTRPRHRDKLSILERIKWAWDLLITGRPWEDEFVLTAEEATRLGKTIHQWGVMKKRKSAQSKASNVFIPYNRIKDEQES